MNTITTLDLEKATSVVVAKLLGCKKTDEKIKNLIEQAKAELKEQFEGKSKAENNKKIVKWIEENHKEESKEPEQEPIKTKKYIQIEIDGMKKRGGWRGGGRPKTTGQTTVAIRIDKRLKERVNKLKEQLKNGTLTDEQEKDVIKIEDLKNLIEKTKREHEERYFKSSGDEKIKNYAMATAITHFDIVLENFIKNNC